MGRLRFTASRLIKDFASFLPGVCLILGFLVARLVTSMQPTVQPPESDSVVSWSEKKIGEVPRDRFYYEENQGMKPVVARVPETDKQGVPILKSVLVPAGQGRPVLVGQELTEVLIPTLGTMPFGN